MEKSLHAGLRKNFVLHQRKLTRCSSALRRCSSSKIRSWHANTVSGFAAGYSIRGWWLNTRRRTKSRQARYSADKLVPTLSFGGRPEHVGMTTFFISRHPGAVVWAMRQGLHIDRVLAHLDPSLVQAGDTVAGTLPLPLASDVCACGARYLHLSFDLPWELRGQELSAEQLSEMGAQLCEYKVEPFSTRAAYVKPKACLN
jgi:CRISPR-associated protein Csx16